MWMSLSLCIMFLHAWPKTPTKQSYRKASIYQDFPISVIVSGMKNMFLSS